MLLEVIARDLVDIKKINEKSKADRIEFCSNLHIGGLTPTKYELRYMKSKLPVNVMIRNNDNDFIFTKEELKEMIEDIKLCGENKDITGVVIGAITKGGEINEEFLKEAVSVAKTFNLNVTFHKAFDLVNDFEKAYDVLCKYEVNTVLTSGGLVKKIDENLDILDKLKKKNGFTKILGGGGINRDNILKVTPYVNEIHLGTLVRENNSFDYPIDVNKINKIKILIDGG